MMEQRFRKEAGKADAQSTAGFVSEALRRQVTAADISHTEQRQTVQ